MLPDPSVTARASAFDWTAGWRAFFAKLSITDGEWRFAPHPARPQLGGEWGLRSATPRTLVIVSASWQAAGPPKSCSGMAGSGAARPPRHAARRGSGGSATPAVWLRRCRGRTAVPAPLVWRCCLSAATGRRASSMATPCGRADNCHNERSPSKPSQPPGSPRCQRSWPRPSSRRERAMPRHRHRGVGLSRVRGSHGLFAVGGSSIERGIGCLC